MTIFNAYAIKAPEGDVLLFQGPNDGEVEVTDGVMGMTGGFSTYVYLSLFGGNAEDAGAQDDPNNWWGNIGESDPGKQYRSRTQYLLDNIVPTSEGLKRIEDAARFDLAPMIAGGMASTITVTATMPAVRRVDLSVKIEARGQEIEFNFTKNWGAMQTESPLIEVFDAPAAQGPFWTNGGGAYYQNGNDEFYLLGGS